MEDEIGRKCSKHRGNEKLVTHAKYSSGYLKERDHLRYLCVCGRILLKWIFEEKGMRLYTGSNLTMIGPIADSCENCN
jgi:hypothetical protein